MTIIRFPVERTRKPFLQAMAELERRWDHCLSASKDNEEKARKLLLDILAVRDSKFVFLWDEDRKPCDQ